MTDDGECLAINTYGYILTRTARDALEHLAAQGYRAFELTTWSAINTLVLPAGDFSDPSRGAD